MSNTGLKVSASSLSRASAGRANNSDTLARLQALDKNGDGQLDLDEVCDAIDEIVRKERTERTLKWMLAALAVFSLLTIAATVGLTYAVVTLSKDTQVDGSVLQSKDSGEAVRTGSFLQSQNATALAAATAASDDPAAVLGRITSIKVPSLKEGEAYTVHKVDAVTMLLNGSVVVRTSTGLDVLMPVDNLVGTAAQATNATADAQSAGRKLLQTSSGEYTFTIWQSTSSSTGRKYQFTVTNATTVADIIAKFSNTTLVGDLAPAPSVIKLKTSGTATTSVAPTATLGSLQLATPELYIDVRIVSYAIPCSGICTQALQTIYLPVGDKVAGIKREVAFARTPTSGGTSSAPVSSQTVYKYVADNLLNNRNMLADALDPYAPPNPYCTASSCNVKIVVAASTTVQVQ